MTDCRSSCLLPLISINEKRSVPSLKLPIFVCGRCTNNFDVAIFKLQC